MKYLMYKIALFNLLFVFLFFLFGFTNQNIIKNNTSIYHLYFNTLIAFPEKALGQNNTNSQMYDKEKITPTEFNNILLELYKNNFVLVDIDNTYSYTGINIHPKDPTLPKGKKPIILSFDNVTYKSNYQNAGEVDKIIIDRNNSLATYSTKQSIQDRISHNNEFIPLLESFVCEHPDFSHNGAKGIICFSGENGILGYNTNLKHASSKQDIKRASQVVSRLKSSGWKFACNNYIYKSENTLSDIEFTKHINLWTNEIKPIIEDTNIYAYHRNNTLVDPIKQNILQDYNFNIFFTDSSTPSFEIVNNSIFMSRLFVCGENIRNSPELFEELFDCKKIYDHKYRTIKYPTK